MEGWSYRQTPCVTNDATAMQCSTAVNKWGEHLWRFFFSLWCCVMDSIDRCAYGMPSSPTIFCCWFHFVLYKDDATHSGNSGPRLSINKHFYSTIAGEEKKKKNVFFFSQINFTRDGLTTSSTKEFRVVLDLSNSHLKMRASHIHWTDTENLGRSVSALLCVHVDFYFFFPTSSPTVEWTHDNPPQNWNSLWIKLLSLSLHTSNNFLYVQ